MIDKEDMVDSMFDASEQQFIYSCILYECHDKQVLSDEEYDMDCQVLLSNYDMLSSDFTDRVDKERLSTGTASGFEFTEEEEMLALEWYNDYMDLKESMGL